MAKLYRDGRDEEARKLEEERLASPLPRGSPEALVWHAYCVIRNASSDSMGGVDLLRGIEFYFSEDQPGEFLEDVLARLVRRLAPRVLAEDRRIRSTKVKKLS